MDQKIRWGIIGLGNIARHFAKDLSLVKDGELVAVASRNKDKASEFAKEYQVDSAYGSYKELMEDKEVDVVYIATPHTSHAELSILCMEHGKHVLCEKPMGVNRAEVERMIAVAQKQEVFLMEALWSRFNPTIYKVKELVDQGAIGDIAYLHANFTFYALDRDEGSRLLNPDLAGGSLLDIGIYPIFLAYLILGKPDRVQSTANFHSTGVEAQTSMIFSYKQAHAVLYSGLKSKSEMRAELSGSQGSIFIEPRWHEANAYSIEKEGSEERFELPPTGKGYFHEILEVQACLRANKTQSALWSHQNSLDLIELMDMVRTQNNITFPFEQ